MEIQAQALVTANTANNSAMNASTANGNAASAGSATVTAQTSGDFSAALNGLMGLVPDALSATVKSSSALSGLNVLVQMLNSLNSDSAVVDIENTGKTLDQLDLLMKLMNADGVEGEEILQNPDVQAWLAEIQALFMQQPLPQDDLMFIPIDTQSVNGDIIQESNRNLTRAEASKLLDSFKQLLISTENDGKGTQVNKAVHGLADQMQKLFVSVMQSSPNERKTESLTEADLSLPLKAEAGIRAIGHVPLPGNRLISSRAEKSDGAVPVILTTANPKFDYIAANFVQSKLNVDDSMSEGPLFEPLQDFQSNEADEAPAVPMHEFLKHIQGSQPLVKAPAIIMHAPSFVEDMTEMVIKSFTLETKSEGFTEAKLSLFPQNLGQVDVKLTMHNGLLVAQFMADTSMGKEMLESQLSQLRTTLQNQGIQIEKIEVSQSQAFQSGMFQEQRQQQSQQSNKQQKSSSNDVIQSLDEELNNDPSASAHTPVDSGMNGFDTTA